MPWELDSDRPIYSQIVEKLQRRIVAGYYPIGGKLPSVRELAAEAGVNPNTMQKAFTELERSGLITTLRTSGRIVTEEKELIDNIKETVAKQEIVAFFEKMKEIGFEPRQTLALASEAYKEEE